MWGAQGLLEVRADDVYDNDDDDDDVYYCNC